MDALVLGAHTAKIWTDNVSPPRVLGKLFEGLQDRSAHLLQPATYPQQRISVAISLVAETVLQYSGSVTFRNLQGDIQCSWQRNLTRSRAWSKTGTQVSYGRPLCYTRRYE